MRESEKSICPWDKPMIIQYINLLRQNDEKNHLEIYALAKGIISPFASIPAIPHTYKGGTALNSIPKDSDSTGDTCRGYYNSKVISSMHNVIQAQFGGYYNLSSISGFKTYFKDHLSQILLIYLNFGAIIILTTFLPYKII